MVIALTILISVGFFFGAYKFWKYLGVESLNSVSVLVRYDKYNNKPTIFDYTMHGLFTIMASLVAIGACGGLCFGVCFIIYQIVKWIVN